MRKVAIIEGYQRTRLIHTSHPFNSINLDQKFWLNPQISRTLKILLGIHPRNKSGVHLFLLIIVFLSCSICTKVHLFLFFSPPNYEWVCVWWVGWKSLSAVFMNIVLTWGWTLRVAKTFFNSNTSIHWRVKLNKRLISSNFMVFVFYTL